MKIYSSLTLILILAGTLKLGAAAGPFNMFPIIGVYLEPSEYSQYPADKWSYVAASYIKYLEMAGA